MNTCSRCGFSLWVALVLWSCALPSTAAENEMAGPFPSWRDLRRDYGAVGDGQADDRAALQRALDELTPHKNHCVLFIPAGTYRITGTVGTRRKAHTDCLGVTVTGEDPLRTTLRWDGTNGGTLFHWDAWYSSLSRLTLDGAGRAGIALYVGDAFSTYNETTDLIVRDASVGMQFGTAKSQGQAENMVARCQFLRCRDAGLKTVNFNSMDIWVWHSTFEDCGHALFNVMGNFHAWHNLFLRSRLADIGTQNLMVFSFVGNTSVGSRRFLDFESGHSWGSPTTIAANRILDPVDDLPLRLGNAGPYLVMDNVFALPTGSTNRAARMTWADQTFAGNTYSVSNAVVERGRFRRIAERIAGRAAIPSNLPQLPVTPPRVSRPIFEMASGSDASAIQAALDRAAKLNGKKPVVHLPMGRFAISNTLVVASGTDLQLIGDGGSESGSRLEWTGPAGGVLLHIKGPSRAVLRELFLHAPRGQALLVSGAEQAGGRILAEELNVNGPPPGASPASGQAALSVSGLRQTRLQLRCLQGSGNGVTWVGVDGLGRSAAAGEDHPVEVLCGATGSAVGQYAVRHGGKLVVRGVYHEKSADSVQGLSLDDEGVLTIDATRFSYKTSPAAPLIAFRNFRGLFTIATSLLLPVDSTNTCRFELSGDGSAASVLCLNNSFWVSEHGVTSPKLWLNAARPPVRGGLVGCNVNSGLKGATPNGFAFLENLGEHPDPARSKFGAGPLDNIGTLSDAAVLQHLAPLRRTTGEDLPRPAPVGATDLLIQRVMANGSERAVEFRGN